MGQVNALTSTLDQGCVRGGMFLRFSHHLRLRCGIDGLAILALLAFFLLKSNSFRVIVFVEWLLFSTSLIFLDLEISAKLENKRNRIPPFADFRSSALFLNWKIMQYWKVNASDSPRIPQPDLRDFRDVLEINVRNQLKFLLTTAAN